MRLHQIPSSALTLLILAKRHPGPFTQDTDATNLPTLCDQGLQAMVHGDALPNGCSNAAKPKENLPKASGSWPMPKERSLPGRAKYPHDPRRRHR